MRWPVPSNFTGFPNNGGCPSEPAVHECLATWTCNAYGEECPEERLGRQVFTDRARKRSLPRSGPGAENRRKSQLWFGDGIHNALETSRDRGNVGENRGVARSE